MYHNHHLQQAIEELQKENPNVIVVYGNYYQAYHNAKLLGFNIKSIQKSCCGTGGDYNFSFMHICGVSRVLVCFNLDKSLNWDGSHLTQQAYKFMARWLIQDIYPKLQCNFST
ncbi:hypothetical protein QQP08_021971 [Theobroma cacao]|nr:hypothetical protein QQP08_021971 [Theobroma cacao]